FIDEAYSLCRGGDKDFGREAIDALVKAMEDHKEDFVLILAGYNQEMDEFIHANPGLQSRLPLQIDFPDYNLEELLAISKLMYQKREYLLSEGSKIELERALRRVLLQDPRYNGNARTVRNLVEASLRCQAVRLINNKKQDQENLDKEGLSLINEADIRLAAHKVFANKKRKENQANRNNDIPEAQAY
ncbi:MAG: AAA family ATPase, partial [Clostridiales bacterium]